jgi:PPM family protein phosphatase
MALSTSDLTIITYLRYRLSVEECVPTILDKLFGRRKTTETAPTGEADITQPVVTRPRDPTATMPLPEAPAGIDDTMKSTPISSATRRMTLGIAQHVGRVRTHNEDVLLVFTGELAGLETMPNFGLFVVADGMGGHALGERASGIAARTMARETLERILPFLLSDPRSEADRPSLNEVMETAMNAANREVFNGVPEGGGTTLTCAVIIGEQLVLSHVGDSRAYIINGDICEQITRDHSLVQRLQELGQLSAAEAAIHPQRNVLYRAVGQGEGLEVDVATRRLAPGSSVLLCSDGLWGLVPDDRIMEIIRQTPSPQAACEALVSAANSAGGPDNITAVMVKLPG